jgi:hypothetical protein
VRFQRWHTIPPAQVNFNSRRFYRTLIDNAGMKIVSWNIGRLTAHETKGRPSHR